MVNYRDPTVIAQSFLTLVKLWHIVDGLVIWEFLTTLSYEWSIIRGRRPYRWTIWIHSLTRVAAFAAVITNLVSTDVTAPVNCQASIITQFIFAYTSLAAASLLIVFRMCASYSVSYDPPPMHVCMAVTRIAIWKRNKLISAIASTIWVTNVSFLIYGVIQVRAEWTPGQDSCTIFNAESRKLCVIVALVTDVVLFLIMLSGLLRLGVHFGGTFILGRFLWKQGIIWFLLATIVEVPSTAFICLNLNDPLDVMLQFPCLVTTSIAASRMYRSLADFVSSNITCETPQNIGHTITKTKDGPISHTPLTSSEVAVHTTYEEYPMSRIHHIGTSINMDEKLRTGRPY